VGKCGLVRDNEKKKKDNLLLYALDKMCSFHNSNSLRFPEYDNPVLIGHGEKFGSMIETLIECRTLLVRKNK
jgi:hypothetical protein